MLRPIWTNAPGGDLSHTTIRASDHPREPYSFGHGIMVGRPERRDCNFRLQKPARNGQRKMAGGVRSDRGTFHGVSVLCRIFLVVDSGLSRSGRTRFDSFFTSSCIHYDWASDSFHRTGPNVTSNVD